MTGHDPDMEVVCPSVCTGPWLRYVKSYDTDWYGRLSYYKCSCCKTTFVSQGGSSLMVAAIQL